jgi:glycosyltransferase involved in cell wall biosynthesis
MSVNSVIKDHPRARFQSDVQGGEEAQGTGSLWRPIPADTQHERQMSLLLLHDRIPWFGAHSGYEQLASYLVKESSWPVVTARPGEWARFAGSAYGRMQGRYGRGATDLCELEFRLRRRIQKPDASHILYLEHHLELLKPWTKAPKNLIGTLHHPQSVWKPEHSRILSRLASALVLFRRDLPFFESFIGKGRVKFIPHGADTDFFRPDFSQTQLPPRILYSGVYLRNEPMLVRVLNRLSEKIPDLRFDLLVPRHHRSSPDLAPLRGHPAVSWHADLNDEALRRLYQRSYLMLLPMNDSGANTAVIESLSSGLPIVTTEVGGIRDYGGGTVFPMVANNDDDAMVELAAQYCAKTAWRQEIARNCRHYAEDTLAWPLIAAKHQELYHELTA